MKEFTPKEINRELIFEITKASPMPMVTITKTVDVLPLIKFSRRTGIRYNALLCWCIGKAASEIPAFYMVPKQDTYVQYDELRISLVVTTQSGYQFAGIPYKPSLAEFYDLYCKTVNAVKQTDLSNGLDGDFARIGTSAIPDCSFDCISNFYCPSLTNPFFAWGKYKKHLLRADLPISFHFHHAQMDGGHAARFFNSLEAVIRSIRQYSQN